MDTSENIAEQYLKSRGLVDIEYEPDGNVPPDFLIGGSIAVEVRRLNKNEYNNNKIRGLEETGIPLRQKIERVLASFPNKQNRNSLFLFYKFSRSLSDLGALQR